MSEKSSPRKKRDWWEKPNTIGIYAFATGLFILTTLSSINSTGISIGSSQIIVITLIVVLLLFRYFSEIRIGKLLELKKTVERVELKQNEFREATAEKVLEMKEQQKEAPLITKKSIIDSTMPYEQKENIAVKLLEDPNYRWRPRKTILRKTGMTESEFEEFMASHPEVMFSPYPDEYGNQLCGLRERIKNYL